MTKPKITVRLANESEYDEVGAITVRAYESVPGALEEGRDIYRSVLGDVATRARSADILVAVDETGAILGGVTYVGDNASDMSEWDEPNVGGFRMLAVAPQAQGRGVGRLLTEACIERARSTSREAVLLHTIKEFVAAQHIYASLGFQRDESLDHDLGYVYLMGYRLPLK